MLLLHIFTTLLLLTHLTHAQTTFPPDLLSISPAVTYITITDPTSPSTHTITLANGTDTTLELEATIQTTTTDIIGRPSLTNLTDTDDAGLAAAVNLSPKTLTLLPQEIAQVQVTLHPQFLKPGGNYLSLIFTDQATTLGQQRILPAISSLLLIRNPNGEDRQLSLTDSNLPRITFAPPTDITLNFSNQGNIHTIPYGQVVAANILGETTSTGYLNQDSTPVMPGTTAPIIASTRVQKNPLPIDLLNYHVSGNDELRTLTFDYSRQLIYISPLAIMLFIFLLTLILCVYLYRRFGLRLTKA